MSLLDEASWGHSLLHKNDHREPAIGEIGYAADEAIDHPRHYTSHPSGIECIQVAEHMGFNLGNAVKYIWRCDLKCDEIEDLKKARWYLDREIAKREDAK